MTEEYPSWCSETPVWRGGERDAATGLTRWNVEAGSLCLDVGPADWRPYGFLKLQARCTQKTGARLRLEALGCEEELLGHVTFEADWQGKRDLLFPLSTFEPRSAADERWHLVHALRLTCERPGLEPTTLILGAIEVTSGLSC
jgi:hypothetical protein